MDGIKFFCAKRRLLQNKENLREHERALTDDVGLVYPVKIA